MSAITGEQIWGALSAEPNFLTQVPEPAHQVWEELAVAAGSSIEPVAALPLTANNFIVAKTAIFKFMLEGGWVQRIITAYPDEAFVLGKEVAVEVATSQLAELVEVLDQHAGHVNETLAAQGITEEQFLMDDKGGRLTLDSAIKWREGNFTIGDLALTQPSALFRND